MTTLDQPLNPAARRSVLKRAYASSKLAKMTTTALVVYVLVNTPVALAQSAQPIRQAEVLELAPKTANTQPTKIALVIGNAQYTDAGKLGNPVNDATDLADKLKAVGFTDPILAINQTTAQFKQTLKTFRSRLRPNAEVVVYYAGHGMSVDGMNYLLPVDVKLESKADLEDEAIPLKRIIKEMSDAQVKTSVLILDSCRNNPFSRAWKSTGSTKRDLTARGWSSEAVSKAAAGIKIFYATSDGEVANDGAGRNGHFTSSLLRHIDTPGMSLNDMIDQVTADLSNDPKVKQTPWSEGSMIGTYYFKPPPVSAKNASLREKGLAGDQKAFDEWLKNDPDAGKAIEKYMLSKQANVGGANPPLTISAQADKKTAALVIAQQQSHDIGQRQLGTAMAAYLKDSRLNTTRLKDLTDMVLQGNPFAALMVHSLEKTVKSSVPIPKNLLDEADAEIERLTKMGDVIAIAWQANIYNSGLLGKSKNEGKAFELMKLAADKNYTYAQFRLGKFYFDGEGVSKNASKAAEWFKKAADAGDPYGMVELAALFREGKGVARDYAQAFDLAKKAEAMNDAFGMSELASLYLNGMGVTQSDRRAFELYEKAAFTGNSKGMTNLGWSYGEGKGVSVDDSKAVEWYKKSVEQGDYGGMSRLGYMYLNGKGVVKDEKKGFELVKLAAEEKDSYAMQYLGYLYLEGRGIAKAEAKAMEWYLKAAEAGEQSAQMLLGDSYRDGSRGLKQDGEQSKKWYLKAIENGSAEAMNNLAYMYYQGTTVAKDDAKAVEWYKKAAIAGNSDGMFGLASMYRSGKGISKDETKAVEWYKKSADANNNIAQFALGNLYRDGMLGQKQDGEQARSWYLKAIENGNKDAFVNLGWMYEHGKGVVKNETEALKLYEKAAEAGIPGGVANLGVMYLNGNGVTKNESKAVDLFKKAAEAEQLNAIYALGSMHWSGQGGLQVDKTEANRLFRKAADLGHEDAIKFLAQ